MLNKVLKKIKAADKKPAKDFLPLSSNKKYPTSKMNKNTGFRAKKDSLSGAERQRSMGNRMNKPPR